MDHVWKLEYEMYHTTKYGVYFPIMCQEKTENKPIHQMYEIFGEKHFSQSV